MVQGVNNMRYVVSIHASQTGGDLMLAAQGAIREFQSTPPKREATALHLLRFGNVKVSIHASQTGGDL